MRYEQNIGDPWNVCPLSDVVLGEHYCVQDGHPRGKIIDECTAGKWRLCSAIVRRKMEELGL
jgi:hypothetical protein